MFTIEGRTVYIARGKGRSDTVNICDANNRRGEYAWIIRIFKPTVVNEDEISKFSRIQELVQWLTTELSGGIERKPDPDYSTGDHAAIFPPVASFDPSQDSWTQQAIWHVEHALDQLVHEFLEFPYLHRVEHSLHAKFFSMLTCQMHFAQFYPLAGGKVQTQTVHKEWPETIARDAQKRGNFDIAIVAPAQLAVASLQDFREGRIAAPIVIEMGLDYDAAHLAADEEKLVNSAVPHPYLVHLMRRCCSDERTDRILFQPTGNIRSVYVGATKNKRFYKLLGDKAPKLGTRTASLTM
jgi:hypothetical protein